MQAGILCVLLILSSPIWDNKEVGDAPLEEHVLSLCFPVAGGEVLHGPIAGALIRILSVPR